MTLTLGELMKDTKYSTSFSFKCSSPRVEVIGNEFHGKIAFCVIAAIKNDESTLMNVSLDMEGHFVVVNDDAAQKAGIDINRFAEMVDMNGLVALSQIVRATLLSVTAQSGIQPGLVMPMINIVELKKQKRMR